MPAGNKLNEEGEKRCQELLSQLEDQAVKVLQLGAFFRIYGFFVMSGQEMLFYVYGLLAEFANTLEAQNLFRHNTAQGEFGASIFWVNSETSFADTEDLIIGWQTRRDLQRRGIVEVIEHD